MGWCIYDITSGRDFILVDTFPRWEIAVDCYQLLCDYYPDRSFLLVKGMCISIRFKEG